MKLPLAILALTLSAFGIGTSEFVINGLLPQIANDLGVSIAQAGLLISGFAAGIIVGAPTLTIMTLRLPQKTVLQGALVIFIAGSALSALAQDYWVLMIGRIVSAMAVGAFYGVGSVVAASLGEPQRQASAIALMFAGATAATVFGVPLGTLLGQEFGWRLTYWVVTAIGVLGLFGVTALVPAAIHRAAPDLRKEFGMLKRPQVWLALAMTACSFGAIAATFTYIAPFLQEVGGFSERGVTGVLFVIGVGLFVGNYLGGRAADKNLLGTLITLFAAFAIVLVAFGFTARSPITAVVTAFLFGTAGYALVPGAQLRVVSVAKDAPTLASALNISAFNVGVTIGAALGAAAIGAKLGVVSITWISAAIASIGLLLAIVSHPTPAARDIDALDCKTTS
jgi:MFS transporter, DHA1 family, inner membrane transport protein